LPVAIPELSPGSPLLQALPEFKALENYGGATIEANIQAATTRFKLYKKAVEDVKAKVSAVNNRPNEILGPNWQVSEAFSAGGSVSEEDITSFRATLTRSSNTELRAAYRAFFGLRQSDAIQGQRDNIARLIDFLRLDNPNISVNEVVESSLGKGIKFVPKTNRNGSGSISSSVADVVVPFKIDNGVITPSVDLSEYRRALSSLDEFRKQNVFPQNLNPKKISLVISATQKDFEAEYFKVSGTERDLSRTQGANIARRADGTAITRSDDLGGTMTNKTSVILINHEFSLAQGGEFGGENSIAETVLHEYGHSVHRSISIAWGDPKSPDNSSYDALRAQKISDYGSNNDQEHFAETFAKYIFTGEATPEFKSFLEEQVGIKKFDLDAAFPAFLRGNAVRDQFVQKMSSTDLGVYTPVVGTYSNPYRNYSEGELAAEAQSIIDTGNYPRVSISLEGTVQDSAGRSAGLFQRSINRNPDGKVWVYHKYFKMFTDAQGDGFGTKFINASFDLYREWGAEYVDVNAALDNGPYMWGIMGFDFTSESDRRIRVELARDYLNVLNEYSTNEQELNGLSSQEAAKKIRASLTSQGLPLPTTEKASISAIVEQLRKNGWIVDAELLQQLKNIVNLPAGTATANMLALIGRDKRRTRDKSTSSVGREIMMYSSWTGRKMLKDIV
jgi:hypothetical protein